MVQEIEEFRPKLDVSTFPEKGHLGVLNQREIPGSQTRTNQHASRGVTQESRRPWNKHVWVEPAVRGEARSTGVETHTRNDIASDGGTSVEGDRIWIRTRQNAVPRVSTVSHWQPHLRL